MNKYIIPEQTPVQKIELIKQLISAIEWDLPSISNNIVKERKKTELEDYKKELADLILSVREVI